MLPGRPSFSYNAKLLSFEKPLPLSRSREVDLLHPQSNANDRKNTPCSEREPWRCRGPYTGSGSRRGAGNRIGAGSRIGAESRLGAQISSHLAAAMAEEGAIKFIFSKIDLIIN